MQWCGHEDDDEDAGQPPGWPVEQQPLVKLKLVRGREYEADCVFAFFQQTLVQTCKCTSTPWMIHSVSFSAADSSGLTGSIFGIFSQLDPADSSSTRARLKAAFDQNSHFTQQFLIISNPNII